jgi:hypothetical protein
MPDDFSDESSSGSSSPTSSYLLQVDVIKSKRAELTSKLSPNHLTESVNDLWLKIEKEAQEYRKPPEEILITSIRQLSSTLNTYINKLRNKSKEVSFTCDITG